MMYLQLCLSGVLTAVPEDLSQLAGVDAALAGPVVLDEGVLELSDLLRAQIRVLHDEEYSYCLSGALQWSEIRSEIQISYVFRCVL